MDYPVYARPVLRFRIPSIPTPSLGLGMTTLSVGDAVSVWLGPSAGAVGTVEKRYAGGDGWTWVVIRTLEGKEVRTHTATVEPMADVSPRAYAGTFLT
jgi:hypothetical protein